MLKTTIWNYFTNVIVKISLSLRPINDISGGYLNNFILEKHVNCFDLIFVRNKSVFYIYCQLTANKVFQAITIGIYR